MMATDKYYLIHLQITFHQPVIAFSHVYTIRPNYCLWFFLISSIPTLSQGAIVFAFSYFKLTINYVFAFQIHIQPRHAWSSQSTSSL